MPQLVVSVVRDGGAVARAEAIGPRIVEVPRPEWRGLFVEPEWPPFEEEGEG